MRLLVTLVQSFLCCVLILHKCSLSCVVGDCYVSARCLASHLIVTLVSSVLIITRLSFHFSSGNQDFCGKGRTFVMHQKTSLVVLGTKAQTG